MLGKNIVMTNRMPWQTKYLYLTFAGIQVANGYLKPMEIEDITTNKVVFTKSWQWRNNLYVATNYLFRAIWVILRMILCTGA